MASCLSLLPLFFFFFVLFFHEREAVAVAVAVQGGQFAKGTIEVAGVELREHSTFTEIVTTAPLSSGDSGATFFSPSSLPSGFFALGSLAKSHSSNSSPPRALIARDTSASLASATDFTLLFSTNSSAFFWLPIPPPGFAAAGHLVTASPQKPHLSSIRCLRSDLLQPCDPKSPIWSAESDSAFTVHLSDSFGTVVFVAGENPPSICINKSLLTVAAMPNLTQITALIETYSPWIHFHPKEPYFPSSVSWFFNNGALLYSNSSPNSPARIDPPAGSNLPQGGTNDGAFWLDLPTDANFIKAGNISSAETYIHIKPALGGTATDIVFWLFYPFNGPARAKVEFFDIALGQIGEHVGDWEHVTQRFSNFDGEMKQMYFSEHSSGKWVDPKDLEYSPDGGKRPAAYATLHGHAFYPKAGMVLLGEMENDGIGVMDETEEGGAVVNAAAKSAVVAAEYLGVEEPAWLQYMREWGPKVKYDVDEELEKVMRFLPQKMKRAVRDLVSRLPKEVLGEEGPTGPKEKASWNGDES